MTNWEDLNDLRDEVHELAREKGWWDGVSYQDAVKLIPEKIALIHSELSEALEAYRSIPAKTPVDECLLERYLDSNGKPDGFVVELADAIIRIMDLCGMLNLDIQSAVSVKHDYNATRPHRHGGKRA